LAFSYIVFGLLVRSNHPLPGVPPAVGFVPSEPYPPDGGALPIREPVPQVNIQMDVPPPAVTTDSSSNEILIYNSPYLDEADQSVLRIWRTGDTSFLRLAYSDGTQFWIDPSRQNVWSTWPPALTLENALSYLLGPVFGLLLRLRGITCLHASAVAFGDWSVVFVGSEGAGKSTTAAALARRGHPVLSDDIVALSMRPRVPSGPGKSGEIAPELSAHVLPAYPHLCLWPDSAQMVLAASESLPRMAREWDKRRLVLGTLGTQFESRVLPLAVIYLFADRAEDLGPTIAPAPAKTSLLSLVANTYANNLLDRAARAQEFAILDGLVAAIPIRILTPHQNPERLEQLCSLVEQDVQSLRRPAPIAAR
jgi:hypothetical protein